MFILLFIFLFYDANVFLISVCSAFIIRVFVYFFFSLFFSLCVLIHACGVTLFIFLFLWCKRFFISVCSAYIIRFYIFFLFFSISLWFTSASWCLHYYFFLFPFLLLMFFLISVCSAYVICVFFFFFFLRCTYFSTIMFFLPPRWLWISPQVSRTTKKIPFPASLSFASFS